jgi:hypothetical protein
MFLPRSNFFLQSELESTGLSSISMMVLRKGLSGKFRTQFLHLANICQSSSHKPNIWQIQINPYCFCEASMYRSATVSLSAFISGRRLVQQDAFCSSCRKSLIWTLDRWSKDYERGSDIFVLFSDSRNRKCLVDGHSFFWIKLRKGFVSFF